MGNRILRRSGALLLAAVLAVGASACRPAVWGKEPMDMGDGWTYEQRIPTAESLLSDGKEQNRYLTLPGSRLVINPFNFETQARETTQVQYANRPSMPLNIGYCDPFMGAGRGIELSNLLLMAEKTSADAAPGAETIWQAALDSDSAWTYGGAAGTDCAASFDGDSASFTVLDSCDEDWEYMETTLTAEVKDTHLSLKVEDISEGGRIAVKVNRGKGEDVSLMETGTPGTYTFNLEELTGWSGKQDIQVRVFAVGKGTTVTFSGLKVQKAPRAYADAKSYSTSWRPDFLGFKASYSKGTKLSGKDFLYDEKTVVRDMEITGKRGFLIYGEYNGAASVQDGTVLIQRENFSYAITLSEDVAPVFYPSLAEALAGGEGSASPPEGGYGVWAFQLDAPPERGVLRAAVSFDTKEADGAAVAALSQAPGDDCADRLAQRTAQWDDLLARVPRPANFKLEGIKTKGVSAADVRQSYYEAWVQVIGNALPANPEIGYDYPSFATGKASLWGYGSPMCSYSATWEALYGMSYYAQIDPDAAWEMYKGLMSLVDEEGMIAGESLPPNNARVGWILYTVKQDKEALAEIQPALTKHLQWRFENPRWIFGNSTPDTQQKDIDFVASALLDVRYLMRINEELGLESENAQWETVIDQQYANMVEWFFPDSMEYPVQYFTLKDNSRSAGNALWVTKALHVPGVEQTEVEDMLRLLETRYDPGKPFCGVSMIKYEPYMYTVLGLLEHGYGEQGRTLAVTAVRDIVLSGIQSEGYCYAGDETEPLPEGVRPSMFGAAMMIDCVWLMNGVRMDDGMPVFANYFDQDGGVENLKVDGKTFNMKKEDNTFTYGGAYLEETMTMEAEAGQAVLPFPGTNVHPIG